MNQESTGPGDRGYADQARLTPYELVFASEEFEARLFPSIQEEADLLGRDALRPEEFNFLSTSARAVRDLVPVDAPAELIEQHRVLLFQAFNFWRFGKRVYLLDPGVARFLVEAAPRMQGWELTLPHPTVYVQLPANLFWGSITPDSTPEPVDGFFVSAAATEDAFGKPFQRLEILAVLGIRRDRAGFSIIPFDTEAGPGIAATWAEAAGREGGQDFENILPGGEIRGLYSLLTTAEVLKLVGRSLWYADRFPECLVPEAALDRGTADRPGAPPVPRLPYCRMTLCEEAGG